MPSNALHIWLTTRAAALDEIDSAHGLVRGSGPGKRLAIQQINQAYVMLLSSHFQGFCRELHSETADFIAGAVPRAAVRSIVLADLMDHTLAIRTQATSARTSIDSVSPTGPRSRPRTAAIGNEKSCSWNSTNGGTRSPIRTSILRGWGG